MSTIDTALKEASLALFTITRDRTQAWLEAELLLGKALSKDRVWLLAHQDHVLDQRSQNIFKRLLKRRLAHEPLAYLFGEAPFCGRLFAVTKATLIPRIETEQLIEEARNIISQTPPGTLIWDVGTGSGVLVITLKALFPHHRVIGTDFSAPALRIAKKNAKRLLTDQPAFLQADLLDHRVATFLKKEGPSELIVVANLPYLPAIQKRELSSQVLKYEPLHALFAEKQGRALNEKLMRELAHFGKETKIKITALLEFDPSQAASLTVFSKQYFRQTKILLDLHKRARFLQLSS